MKVEILATGSDGNCIFLQSGSTGILIDAGKWKRDLEKRLLSRGINAATDIQAVFITHSHSDHIKGLTLANKYHIPVYATHGEWQKISGVDEELQHVLETTYSKYDIVELGNLRVQPFQIHHNTLEPVGYAVEDDDGNRACVVFDTGHIDDDMLDMMEGSNIYIIEANHDSDMLRDGTYDAYLKDRIADPHRGHLSNDQTAAALQQLIKGKGEQIYLTHLSSNNNTPELASQAVRMALFDKGFINKRDYFLEVL
ncbi:MBL fold hydrolase [Paenibacillus antibioticophila]|uniref:MBL fold hydrolase n=1 Tax=Paenibacillus antibioticophila TaxID=1274374 RepID=A0A919Y176_9BACL|nr:MBL fold metallo-hydrolase [Paenibacillus antibioticophila]GIO40175.1 MBL fold hydrolase [Paenibacillus antibioticophila]